jgi:hypothetical protein
MAIEAQWLQLPQKQLNFGPRGGFIHLNTENRAGSFYVQMCPN